MVAPLLSPNDSPPMPTAPIRRLLLPIQRFLHVEANSGIVLVVCTVAALILANSRFAESIAAFLHLPFRVTVGTWSLKMDLLHVINDGLMTIFFFVVGLEIKREIVAGELRTWQKAVLPMIAALGGMIVPALIYLLAAQVLRLNTREGWSIPMATDIAFVVGVLALFGPRAPAGLKIFLLSLAIVDDLGAVLVIAVVFTEQLALGALAAAAGALALILAMQKLGIRAIPLYVAVGALIWLAIFYSGVHPTVAGVVLGLMTPTQKYFPTPALLSVLHQVIALAHHSPSPEHEKKSALAQAKFATREAMSPLERLENGLHPWVAFVIMPLFAFANAGVEVRLDSLTESQSVAVALGLLLGKPLGILLFCLAAVRLGFAHLPSGVSWFTLVGASCLAGIGFTMSLFLASLALPEESLPAGKIGILVGSLASAVLGSILLLLANSARSSDSALLTDGH